jgi:hypothetical protein
MTGFVVPDVMHAGALGRGPRQEREHEAGDEDL